MTTTALLPELRKLLASPEPPELGPGPRVGVWSAERVNAGVEEIMARGSLPSARRQLIRALILLWHDQHEPAHAIVQDGEDADSSYLHAILHRREPDYCNAKYWFRRVRQHPVQVELASKVSALLERHGEAELAARLVPQGRWDAFAFVEACEAAAGRPASDARKNLLREIQKIEFEVLLEHLCRPE